MNKNEPCSPKKMGLSIHSLLIVISLLAVSNPAQSNLTTALDFELNAISESSDLGITGNVSPEPVRSGSNLAYVWSVTNNGPDTATGVGMMQILNVETEFVSATASQGTCTGPDSNSPQDEGTETGRVRCDIGTLTNGASATITVVVKVIDFGDGSASGGENDTIDSNGYIRSNQEDDNSTNDSKSLFATALPSLNKPPLVTVTSPISGTIFVSPSQSPISIPVKMTASDPDGNVDQVQLIDNGNVLGTATSTGNGNYSFIINPPAYRNHILVAIVKDNGGRTTISDPVNFIVNSSSTVAIVNPPGTIVPGTSLQIETRSSVPGARLNKIELFANGTLLGQLRAVSTAGDFYTHRFSWNNVQRGGYVLQAILTELSGATTTSTTTVIVADVPAAISITSPTDGQSFNSNPVVPVNVLVNGTGGYVDRIEYYASGTPIGSDLNSISAGQRTFNWQKPDDGIYSLVAIARDDLGVTTTSNAVNIGINRSSPAIGESVWVDDGIPSGATTGGDDGWKWLNTNPTALAGTLAHQSLLKSGMHEHFFEGSAFKLQVNAGEKLSAWIFIDPDYAPTEVMLQWKESGVWEHRAYWGQNQISLGTDGSNSRRRIGDIPTAGRWVQLVIPAIQVGLEGKLVDGMKFTLFSGRAAWDRVGKISASVPNPQP